MVGLKSESGIQILLGRLLSEFGLAPMIGQPQVAYRERLGRAVEIDYTHKNQFGGRPQFARVKIQFEPLEPGSGFVFENAIVDGAFHDLDSSVLAFEIAARGAFRELKGKGDPRLMEPMVALTISVPPGQADSVRKLLEKLGATGIPRLQDQSALELEFSARLVAVIGLRQTLIDHVAGAELVAMRFAGMRDVDRQFPGDGGDDCPPLAMRLRA